MAGRGAPRGLAVTWGSEQPVSAPTRGATRRHFRRRANIATESPDVLRVGGPAWTAPLLWIMAGCSACAATRSPSLRPTTPPTCCAAHAVGTPGRSLRSRCSWSPAPAGPARAPSWTDSAADCRNPRCSRPTSSFRSPSWVGTAGATPGSWWPMASPSTGAATVLCGSLQPEQLEPLPARRLVGEIHFCNLDCPGRGARRAAASPADLARLGRAADHRASALRRVPAIPDRSNLRHQHPQRRGGCRPGGPVGHRPSPPLDRPADPPGLPLGSGHG
jgi:hypothetical protein